jgi:DnaD/phage-associated family protein
VRYDKELKPIERLLYGEISALANQYGMCWARNKYFADLYEVSPQTISRYISNLEKKKYIHTKLIYKKGTKQIERREIYLAQVKEAESNINTPIDRTVDTPIDQTVKENITRTEYNNNNAREVATKKPNAFTVYEQNGFGLLNGTIIGHINNWLEDFIQLGATEQEADQLICLALKKSAENNVLKWAYTHKILLNWLSKKITRVSQVEAHEKQREQSQEMKTEEGKPDLSWEEELDNL